jgi:hypothetical protein
MKTKFYWLALIVSAALSGPAQAGHHHGGGNSAVAARGAPARSSAPSFQSMPRGNFGGRRMSMPSQRFSSVGMRSSSNAFRQHYINSSGSAAIGTRQFTPGNFNRSGPVTRFENRGNRLGQITNPAGERTGAIQNQTGGNRLARFGNNRNDRLAQLGSGASEHNGMIGNRGGSAGRVRNANNNLRADWRNHVFARRSAQWNRNWDRNRDHRWHGHDCRFVNGSWIIFDLGFYPWWPYSYPYDYYAYDYYPYSYNYDPGYYDPGYNDSRYNDSGYNDSGVYQGEEYYDQGNYDSSDQYSSSDSTIAAVQERLARQGYYRGEIDGILGSQTRRAIARYQRGHGLRVTGNLTPDMLQALGLEEVASN